uniref:Nicotinate phosphoribosyltransferase n=1 Tax=Globodera rostochiensis TaxID=31243 RepID=A0A914HWY8_GLORO
MNDQKVINQSLLTDDYQLNMAYSYWQQSLHKKRARFELFFRKNPFKGEFTVFAGLEDCLYFVRDLHFSESDMEYIQRVALPYAETAFFDYLRTEFNCKEVKISAILEGTVVFPRVPLIIVEGPLAVCQLLETPLLNLVNYASLVTTNAARFRLAAGDSIGLFEFGLRRAQGPNGALSASKYCFIGGFESTSNLLAGKLYGIPVSGTMAHSFVTSFEPYEPIKRPNLRLNTGEEVDLFQLSKDKLDFMLRIESIDWAVAREDLNMGELAAFCAYAIAHPNSLVALIDTYDTLRSGLVNFCACALALAELGFRAIGCRIDSGDLAFLSKQIRQRFRKLAIETKIEWLADMKIVGSNDINEETIVALRSQNHELNAFGVGTHLVTCQQQPALGCVYKLVDLDGKAKIKLSESKNKLLITGRKKAFRLYSKTGVPLVDLLMLEEESDPMPHEEILCLHPFEQGKRAKVFPDRVETLHHVYWEDARIVKPLPSLSQIREHARTSLHSLREDHRRFLNPTPYKISLSQRLYDFFHRIWLQNAPIGQLW